MIASQPTHGAATPVPQRDALYLLAFAAGPVVWLALYLWATPELAPERFWLAPLAVVLGIVLYPVAEEWLFRGVIQGVLATRPIGRLQWGAISSANLIVSLLFAAFHALNHPPLWAAPVFFPSLLFGLFRDRYGRIGPSILLHAFYNAGYFSLWPPA